MNEWIVVAASAGVVALMVAIAAMLGFRQHARLDETELRRLAGIEGATLEAFLLAPDARSAISKLDADRLLVARVMADGVSARVTPVAGVRLRARDRRIEVAFADIGFPPLHLQAKEAPPAWLVALAQGE